MRNSLPLVLAIGAALAALSIGVAAQQPQPATSAAQSANSNWQQLHAERMAAMFGRMDANSDGRVTRAEFDAAANAMHAERMAAGGRGTPPSDAQRRERMDARFASMDADKDGAVTRAEFDASAGAMRGGRMHGMGGGRAGMRHAPLTDAQLRERRDARFRAMDSNGDGMISRAEFDAAKPSGRGGMRRGGG